MLQPTNRIQFPDCHEFRIAYITLRLSHIFLLCPKIYFHIASWLHLILAPQMLTEF